MIQCGTQAAVHGSRTAWLDHQEVTANDTSESQLFASGSLQRLEHLELRWVSASMEPLPGLWFQGVMEGWPGVSRAGRGFQQEGVAHRITDRPRFFLQRKASTMSVSCATRCSTPRPSSSVTSSSTALRAWEAPSNAPCASQVGVPGGEQVRRGKGPRSPALQALGSVPGAVWLRSSWRTP